MSEPTIEEVKEVLVKWDKHHGPDEPFMRPFVAAARLWVDAAEPDIEAVADALDGGIMTGPFEWRMNEARRLMGLALGDNNLIRRADR